MFGDFELPERLGEVIQPTLRQIHVDVQAVLLRVDVQAIRLDVKALLVASDANSLRRIHRDLDVWFVDGETGDDGLEMTGGLDPTLWNESVVFSDGTLGDNGMTVAQPFAWDDGEVIFTEVEFFANWAINYAEFVTFADFSVQYTLDFLTEELVKFADLSVAWTGVFGGPEFSDTVNISEVMTMGGGNTVALSESVSISEVMIGGPIISLADAVRWSEIVFWVMDYQLQPETVTITDTLVVSEANASDARPGAFVPGAALLGSPT